MKTKHSQASGAECLTWILVSAAELRRSPAPLAVDPLPNKVWTGHDAEIAIFSFAQVRECGDVQFFELR